MLINDYDSSLPNIKAFGIGDASVWLQTCRRIGVVVRAKDSIDPFSQISENAVECLEKSHKLKSPFFFYNVK